MPLNYNDFNTLLRVKCIPRCLTIKKNSLFCLNHNLMNHLFNVAGEINFSKFISIYVS